MYLGGARGLDANRENHPAAGRHHVHRQREALQGAAVRGQARLKLNGLTHVGAGAGSAVSRRDGAEFMHRRRREAYQLHFAAQRLRARWR